MTAPAEIARPKHRLARKRGILWAKFARDIRSTMTSGYIGIRELNRIEGIDKAALSRVRNSRPVTAANFMWICCVMELDPWDYFK